MYCHYNDVYMLLRYIVRLLMSQVTVGEVSIYLAVISKKHRVQFTGLLKRKV